MPDSGQPVEIPLIGGTANRGLVVRKGNTVRRPWRPSSLAVQALLGHLESVGFDGAPRFLGRDRQGREMLSYIAGEAVTPPYPAWATTDSALISVAELLRRYHQAVAGFDPAGLPWSSSPPAAYASGNWICHNDPNLDNIVFRDGRAVALIDFDLASPGEPIWDVAAAARLWCPLRADEFIPDARRGRSLERLRIFVHAYASGSDGLDPNRLVDAVAMNHAWLYAVVRSGAEQGNPGFSDYWQIAEERVARTGRWYVEHRQTMIDALS